ncbi:MAG TPA: prenyltransferase, partial [Candidatus Desulfofervidus auxilii]|nr:prenyltransferase [Candidatus Desulfofervidus auxilii]
MLSWIRLIRLKHWIKNFLVLAPAFFAGKILDENILILSFFAFISFCFSASGLYIINDILDLKYDRLHPKKRHRPLAKGEISQKTALTLSIVFLIFGLSISYEIG